VGTVYPAAISEHELVVLPLGVDLDGLDPLDHPDRRAVGVGVVPLVPELVAGVPVANHAQRAVVDVGIDP